MAADEFWKARIDRELNRLNISDAATGGLLEAPVGPTPGPSLSGGGGTAGTELSLRFACNQRVSEVGSVINGGPENVGAVSPWTRSPRVRNSRASSERAARTFHLGGRGVHSGKPYDSGRGVNTGEPYDFNEMLGTPPSISDLWSDQSSMLSAGSLRAMSVSEAQRATLRSEPMWRRRSTVSRGPLSGRQALLTGKAGNNGGGGCSVASLY